jgi:tRNA pseudouridine38-40 synthase
VRTLKITLSYDGTRFVGWQRQAEGDSVQGVLEDALARFEGGPVTVHGAGRTDAGVHAVGQVASARHDTSTLVRALNARLPIDVRVTAVDDAPPEFHARFSARSKTYRYQIRNAPMVSPFERYWVWHIPEPLALDAMNAAAALLVGTHDFAAFRSSPGRAGPFGAVVPSGPAIPADAVRTIFASAWRESSGLLTYEVSGDGFLRHMVRAIVGTLVEVGRGWRTSDEVRGLLSGATRGEAGATAPAQGLFLAHVVYD